MQQQIPVDLERVWGCCEPELSHQADLMFRQLLGQLKNPRAETHWHLVQQTEQVAKTSQDGPTLRYERVLHPCAWLHMHPNCQQWFRQ